MLTKLRDFLRGIGAGEAAAALALLGVASCAPRHPPGPPVAPGTTGQASIECQTPRWREAAEANAASLQTLAWAPFGRPETGWEIYATLLQHEIETSCPPDSEGFAAALAAWQGRSALPVDGVLSESAFAAVKLAAQSRRAFVRFTSFGACPEPPDLITAARPDEGYGGKQVWLRPRALDAYRRMVAAARAEDPEIAADQRNLSIFSGYRSPSLDAVRCHTEGNCDGVARARCSAHRTGMAVDLYVGQAPGYPPDSSADSNRLFMTRTASYRWLLVNAGRFGFVNYPFEPWHWEWTGEPP